MYTNSHEFVCPWCIKDMHKIKEGLFDITLTSKHPKNTDKENGSEGVMIPRICERCGKDLGFSKDWIIEETCDECTNKTQQTGS